MRETDPREPLPPGLPPIAPRGGWRAALLALGACVVVSAAVSWLALPRLGERYGAAVTWAAGFATLFVAYGQLRPDAPRAHLPRLVAAWLVVTAVAFGTRLLLMR